MKLLENGKIVATDYHLSIADKFKGTSFKKDMFFYVFQLKEYKAKAKYVHGVDVAGEISNNSKGNISSNFSPDKPLEVVEPTKKTIPL